MGFQMEHPQNERRGTCSRSPQRDRGKAADVSADSLIQSLENNMQKDLSGGANGKLQSSAAQLILSTLFSRSLHLVTARSQRRKCRLQLMSRKKGRKGQACLVDEKHIAFDCIDGHWN